MKQIIIGMIIIDENLLRRKYILYRIIHVFYNLSAYQKTIKHHIT